MSTPGDLARELLAAARRDGRRRILGVTGAPGAGKSTLTAQIASALGPADCLVVPMDGFHLADVALRRLGRLDRKGAPDTFDGDGYTALLRRIRDARPGDGPVWAPMFSRDLEQPIAGALEVPADVPLIITEGIYLLSDDGGFSAARGLLDTSWFLEPPDELRRRWLIARHEEFGKSPEAAREWVMGPDEANARIVESTRHRASRVVLSTGEDFAM